MAARNYADRVKDSTTSTGSGNITLSGTAPTGYVAFETAFPNAGGKRFPYVIEGGSEWETGVGYLSASTTLVRETVLRSTNSNAAVNFSAGTKNVFHTNIADTIPRTAILTSDVTYNNTGTLTALSELSFDVEASCTYRIEMFLWGTQNGASGLSKVDFNGGSSTVNSFYGLAITAGGGTSVASLTTTFGVFSGTDINIQFRGILRVNAAGTFIPRAAQFSAAANNTIYKTGSYMTVTKLN